MLQVLEGIEASRLDEFARDDFDDDAEWSNFIPPAVWYYSHEMLVGIRRGSEQEQMLDT